MEFSGTLLQAHQPEQEMRRDEEAKAHEATRGQSPPLRGRCSWKTPPLTASFLTSPRSQTGALPAPAFLSCWRAYPQHGSQERQTTEEVRRSQEEHTSHAGGRQKRGPKPLPPAGRPSIRWDGTGRRLPRAAGLCLHSGAPKPAASRQASSRNPNQDWKQGRSARPRQGERRRAATQRSAAAPTAKAERSGRDRTVRRRPTALRRVFPHGSLPAEARNASRRSPNAREGSRPRRERRQPARSGHCRISARRGSGPTAAPPRRGPTASRSLPPRVPGRPQSPLRGTRAEPKTGTKESRAARTHRPPSLRRTERTQRPPHPDRLREGRREPPRRGSGKEREAEAEAEAEADSAPAGLRQHRGGRRSAARLRSAPLRPSATSSDPLSDAYRPRALLFKHSGPRDWPGG